MTTCYALHTAILPIKATHVFLSITIKPTHYFPAGGSTGLRWIQCHGHLLAPDLLLSPVKCPREQQTHIAARKNIRQHTMNTTPHT